MSEEPGKELLEEFDRTLPSSPYPIDWKIFPDDHFAYQNLLRFANPIDLWEDYAEFLSIEKRHLDYFRHVFLEKESYISFLDVLNQAISSEEFKMIKLGCEMIIAGTAYFCLKPTLEGAQVFISMVSLGITVGMVKIIGMWIRMQMANLEKKEYLEYERRNFRLDSHHKFRSDLSDRNLNTTIIDDTVNLLILDKDFSHDL